MQVVIFPNMQCAECFGVITPLLSEDRQFVTLEHLEKNPNCSQKDELVTVLIKDFTETFVSDNKEKEKDV